MILCYPSYFTEFKCIGGNCKRSCCIGWELDVDPETYEYYMSLEGPFAKEIQKELVKTTEDSYGFSVRINGRCPFLNNNNLCDIVLNLGEEALCEICTDHPRYSFYYGDYIEKSLTISCEEACRLLLNEKDGIKFLEEFFPDEYEKNDIQEEFPDNQQDFEPTDKEIKAFRKERKRIFDILMDRKRLLSDRIREVFDIDEYFVFNSKEERLRILSMLEPINEEWMDVLPKLEECVSAPSLEWEEVVYENLIIYFLYRYLPRGLYDGDIKSKIKFSLFCVYCIRDMEDVMLDVSLAAALFSREVEHSPDNIDLIFEELLFS